jgi:glycosyltransferase involved in cell wall biosynthesis
MNTKLRVAMIGQRSIPATYGGVERAVEELGANLVNRGHSVTAFAWSKDQVPSTHRGIVNRPVFALDGKHARATTQSLCATLLALFGKYDIVHYHAMGPALFAPILRLRRSVAIVATVQGRDDQRSKWGGFAKRMLRFGALSTARVAHETIVVSEQLRENYEEEFARTTTYIPNGLQPVAISGKTDELAAFGVTPGNYLIYVGRLVPEKGLDMIPKAYRDVLTDMPLLIVGDSASTDSYVDELKRDSAQDPRIRFTGAQRGETLYQLFRHAKAMVMPSHLEGLPLVLLEAISFETPLICSDIAPLVQVVGRTSRPGVRVFADGDINGFKAAIEDSLDDDPAVVRTELSSMRERVSVEFGWDRITDATLDVYERALRRRRGSRGRSDSSAGAS